MARELTSKSGRRNETKQGGERGAAEIRFDEQDAETPELGERKCQIHGKGGRAFAGIRARAKDGTDLSRIEQTLAKGSKSAGSSGVTIREDQPGVERRLRNEGDRADARRDEVRPGATVLLTNERLGRTLVRRPRERHQRTEFRPRSAAAVTHSSPPPAAAPRPGCRPSKRGRYLRPRKFGDRTSPPGAWRPAPGSASQSRPRSRPLNGRR